MSPETRGTGKTKPLPGNWPSGPAGEPSLSSTVEAAPELLPRGLPSMLFPVSSWVCAVDTSQRRCCGHKIHLGKWAGSWSLGQLGWTAQEDPISRFVLLENSGNTGHLGHQGTWWVTELGKPCVSRQRRDRKAEVPARSLEDQGYDQVRNSKGWVKLLCLGSCILKLPVTLSLANNRERIRLAASTQLMAWWKPLMPCLPLFLMV